MSTLTKPIALDETLQRVAGALENMELGKGVDTIVAEPYDSTETYAVGDHCIHDGNLYVCSTAIGTAEAWTAGHWTQILLGDEVQSIRGEIPVSIVSPASGTSFTLQPCPVTYNFGEKAELTVTVTATSQYHFMFSCPSGTPTVLTMNGITGTSGDSLEAGKTYEVDIWAGVALIKEVVVTPVT